MKNLRFEGESFDTDLITSIKLLDNSYIKIRTSDGSSYAFLLYDKNTDEAQRKYDELMRMYKEAIRKRESGEEWIERQEELKKFYVDMNRKDVWEWLQSLNKSKIDDKPEEKVKTVQGTLFD